MRWPGIGFPNLQPLSLAIVCRPGARRALRLRNLTRMDTAPFSVQHLSSYQFVDEGPVSDLPPVVLLHGMLGDLSNWTRTIRRLSEQQYRVLVPLLPVYDLPLKQTNVSGLVRYVRGLLEVLDLDQVVLVGNSLGGHVALLYALDHPEEVAALVLSGSSGIYEVEIGTSTLRRHDRGFIRERAAMTFYDPAHATDELVDEMLAVVNNRTQALRLIKMARSAKSETLTERLHRITAPTLLIWGHDDRITPPDVAEAFQRRMPKAELRFIDQCGHAPMIEHPEAFNELTLAFLRETIGSGALVSSPGPS